MVSRSEVTADEVIAFYLPQFHPIPENDEFWGAGFTEWTNVDAARPLFDGHVQPVVPGELGRYDLRDAGVRAAQAAMARAYGVTAFCYWHYWFAGRRVLDGPLRAVVESGEPDLGFCIGWANQSWTGVWHGAPDRMLIEQTYPGDDDHRRHVEALLPVLRDPRYVRVEGRPLVFMLEPESIPDLEHALEIWRATAIDGGVGDPFIVGPCRARGWMPLDHGLDGSVAIGLPGSERLERGEGPLVVDYDDVVDSLTSLVWDGHFPCVLPRWDNTPRSGRGGVVLRGATPARFRQQVADAVAKLAAQPPGRRLLWIKSWNEWAEGNMLEPDARDGTSFLEALRDGLTHATRPARPQAAVWHGPSEHRLKAFVADQLARAAAAEGPLGVGRRHDQAVIPVVLCIDCEPDPRQLDPDAAPALEGFVQTFERISSWRARTEDVTGRPVHVSWFFRMDSQIARAYGNATAFVDRHPAIVGAMLDAGDTVGIHPHAFRWLEATRTWEADFTDEAMLLDNLGIAIDAFTSAIGRPPEAMRYGDSVLSNGVVAAAEAAGVRFDLTIEPGRPVQPIPEEEHAQGLQPDWTRVPRHAYHPDPFDYRRPLRDGTRPLRMLPLTSGTRWRGMSVRSRIDLARANGWRNRRQHSLLYMAAPGWHGRNSFDRVVERAVAAQRRPHLAFAVRSDPVAHPDRWRRIERCLFDLVALQHRHQLAFCTPAQACAALDDPR